MKTLLIFLHTFLAIICITATLSFGQQVGVANFSADLQSWDLSTWPTHFQYNGTIEYDASYIDVNRHVGFVKIFIMDAIQPDTIEIYVFYIPVSTPGHLEIYGQLEQIHFPFTGAFQIMLKVEIWNDSLNAVEYNLISQPFEVDPASLLIITDVDEELFQIDNMYPNPTSGFVTIEAPIEAQLHIINTVGQMVQAIKPNVQNDITKLSAGYYFVTGIHEGNAIKPKKLLITH